ncbi:MAG: MBL fold metallo-hydrolase [Candidatus Sericytochromatia bacterium]|nr:MBL fold metallo-hydrolase [Candidatus Sericytochromatia bacterium]
MPLTLRMLRSGSSGNAALVAGADGTVVLIDAGIGPRVLAGELAAAGLAVRDLAGAVFTHGHSDHLRGGTLALLAREGVPIYMNAGTWRVAEKRMSAREAAQARTTWRPFEAGTAFEVLGLQLAACPVPHGEPGPDNAAGDPVCFTLSDGTDTLGYATDLGHVPPEVEGHLRSARLLVLEANHDPEMLRHSPRPPHVRAWIASDAGHLRNDQAAGLLARLFGGQDGVGVVLAHLSEQCNTHGLARAAAREALDGICEAEVGVAQRHHPTAPWELRSGRVTASKSHPWEALVGVGG